MNEHNSVTLNNEIVILPTFSELTLDEQRYIVEKVKEYVG